jgi:hypothetical protein
VTWLSPSCSLCSAIDLFQPRTGRSRLISVAVHAVKVASDYDNADHNHAQPIPNDEIRIGFSGQLSEARAVGVNWASRAEDRDVVSTEVVA